MCAEERWKSMEMANHLKFVKDSFGFIFPNIGDPCPCVTVTIVWTINCDYPHNPSLKAQKKKYIGKDKICINAPTEKKNCSEYYDSLIRKPMKATWNCLKPSALMCRLGGGDPISQYFFQFRFYNAL